MYTSLINHPDVLKAAKKEVRFFDVNYERGEAWYRAHFPIRPRMGRTIRRRVISGEASPFYLFHPAVPRRAGRIVPRAKIIAILRNPVDRAISSYYEANSKGNEPLSLEGALLAEEERIRGERGRLLDDDSFWSTEYFNFTYKEKGKYINQLREWEGFYPRDQILVIQAERLFSDTPSALFEICDFLGIPPWALSSPGEMNARQYPPTPEHIRNYLEDYFRPYNDQLFEYLGEEWDW